MEDQNSRNSIDITFEVIMEQFQASMLALQVQDVHSTEKSLLIAKNAYSSIEIKNEEIEINDLQALRVLVDTIEVSAIILKSSFLMMDERFQKAKSELEKVMKIIENIEKSLENLILIDFDLDGFEYFLSFMMKCFHIIASSQYISSVAIISRKNGKYVNLFVNVNHRRSQLFEPRLFR